MIKEVLKIPFSVRPFSSSKDRYILVYHDISNPVDPGYSVSYSTQIDRFRSQLEFLSQYFDFVSLSSIIEEKSQNRPQVAITFDDGFASVKKNAWPILQELKIPFLVFLNREAVIEGKLDYGTGYSTAVSYLNVEEIKEMKAAGVDFGSHGISHRILSECKEDELRQEIVGNREFLIQMLGEDAGDFLAFPFGKKQHYNDRVIAVGQEAGHLAFFSTNPSHFQSTNKVVFPRIPILNENNRNLSFLCNRSLFRPIDL
jgi:peptidoglycan/xylan/chitin deacetylase (PgdA/CDA1 family)